MISLKQIDRDDLQSDYIDAILTDAGLICEDESNPPARYQQKYQSLEAKFDKYSAQQLYNEVKEIKPELLEDSLWTDRE